MHQNGLVARGPLTSGPVESEIEDFAQAVERHLSAAARGRVIRFSGGGNALYINYYNVPEYANGGGGAERENNRLALKVEGFARGGDKLTAELMIRFVPSKFGDAQYKLRKKTAAPSVIAKYVADHINFCAETPPNFTHSTPRLEPNRGHEGGPRGSRIDWRFKGSDTTKVLFVTKEPDRRFHLWLEVYGRPLKPEGDFDTKSEAIEALNAAAGHSHRPNRYLTRFQLEKLLRKQSSLSNAEISRMTDDQLRRAVGHERLEEAGDINRNGDDMQSNGRREEPDEHAARELSLFIENDYSLVGAPNSQGKMIEANLLRHAKRGNFDLEKSEKAFMYLMETGAKKYAKEFGDGESAWARLFNKPTRELVAHEFATTFAEEHKLTGMKPNVHVETDEFEAPAHWASAFINGDTSGLEDDDLAEFEAWCAAHPELLNVVDVSEETHDRRWNGLYTELATYTCHLLQNDASPGLEIIPPSRRYGVEDGGGDIRSSHAKKSDALTAAQEYANRQHLTVWVIDRIGDTDPIAVHPSYR